MRGLETDTHVPGPWREVWRLILMYLGLGERFGGSFLLLIGLTGTMQPESGNYILLDNYLLIASLIGTHLPKNYSIN